MGIEEQDEVQQLAVVQKELDEVRAEYAEYARILSHDFIAVFRQIAGLIEVVSMNHQHEWNKETKYHMELALRSSNKGKTLVEQLVNYARTDKESMNLSLVNPKEVFDRAVGELSDLVASASAKFDVKFPSQITADTDQLFNLFYQLLRNALTYRRAGIETEIFVVVEEFGNQWKFSFTDNGIVIPANNRTGVFDLLKRGVSQSDYPDGAGVGLAIAKKIVLNHGGDIWIETHDKPGTSVLFTLAK